MRKYSIVFVHGLARKPPPAKLEEIWRWGLSRPDPNAAAFPNPNPGIDLNVEGRRVLQRGLRDRTRVLLRG